MLGLHPEPHGRWSARETRTKGPGIPLQPTTLAEACGCWEEGGVSKAVETGGPRHCWIFTSQCHPSELPLPRPRAATVVVLPLEQRQLVRVLEQQPGVRRVVGAAPGSAVHAAEVVTGVRAVVAAAGG